MNDERCDLLCIDAPRAEAIRRTLLDQETAAAAADQAQAFADPTRLTLATALLEGEELCVCDLSWIAERKQALVSHHLRTLRDRGLVRSRRDGKLVLYSLTDEGHLLLRVVLNDKTQVSRRVDSRYRLAPASLRRLTNEKSSFAGRSSWHGLA